MSPNGCIGLHVFFETLAYNNIEYRQCKVGQLLKNETENSYYKVITKCDRLLLQSASGITKCGRLLLQSVPGITKCDSYYNVRRNTTPSWKIIPLHLIKTNLGLNFKFRSNLDISVLKLKKFLTYYNIVLKN